MHLHATMDQTDYYTQEEAQIIARVMCFHSMKEDTKRSFVQTYSLNKGLKKFGQKGKDGAYKEMNQLHNRIVFEPVMLQDLNQEEIDKAMESLIFLAEKRDGTIKGRMCANGSTQREYIPKEAASSPTVAKESVLITGVVEAKQRRDVMTLDIPNAFVQTDVPDKDGEKIIMKIRGSLVDILLEIDEEKYKDFIIYRGKEKLLYVKMLKALYGMLMASILYYKKFRRDIEAIGYKVNPYDICVANKMINGKQHTLTWHVDDVKASHVDPEVNSRFAKWAEDTYGSDELGHVKVTRGKKHDYLGMILDYNLDGKLKVDMVYYIENMVEEFPEVLNGKGKAPWNDSLFKVNEKSPILDSEKAELLHSFVMKGMFLVKRARPDLEPGFAFLSTRVKCSTEEDWSKLVKIMNFVKVTKNDILTLEADDTGNLYWHLDAAFAVHQDMKGYTGAIFSLGCGGIDNGLMNQKINSRSSIEAKLVRVDDKISKIV